MVRRVDAATGIAVDIPRAAKLSIFLDDRVGDAEVTKATASAMAQTPAPTIST